MADKFSEVKSTAKLKEFCAVCGKPVRNIEAGSFTSWIFKPTSCTCKLEGAASRKTDNIPALIEQHREDPRLPDQYEILEPIGFGGMGIVFKAKDTKTGNIVAIKVLQMDFIRDQSVLKRFKLEIESTMNLTHANLVSTYDHGTTEDGQPYLIMEYVDGFSLASILEKEGKLALTRALEIFIHLAAVLDYAHNQGVLHRDINPNNVIVCKTETGYEAAKIIDFGIAKVMPEVDRETCNLTESGEIFGSPNYMSPEQCLGFLVNEKSDIYSLGCLMYETISGSTPFIAQNSMRLVMKHINEQVEPFPKALKKDQQAKDLEKLILKCLEKEPEQRFVSMAEIESLLTLIKEGKPVLEDVEPSAKNAVITQFQLIALLVASLALFLYSLEITSSPYGAVYNAQWLLVNVLAITIFLPWGFRSLKNLLKRNGTPQKWWLAIMSASFGSANLIYLPAAILGLAVDSAPGSIIMLHLIFAAFSASALFGYCWFRGTKAVKPGYVFKRLAIIFSLITVSTVSLFPHQVSLFLSKMSYNSPAIEKRLFLEAAIKLDPDYYYYEGLAKTYDIKTDPDKMLFYLEKAYERAPYEPSKNQITRSIIEVLMSTDRLEEAGIQVEKLIESDSSCNNYELAATIKIAENDLDKAQEYYTKAIKNASDPIQYYLSKIDIYLKQKKDKDASELIDTILNQAKSAKLFLIKATVLEQMGRRDEAKGWYRKAVKSIETTIDSVNSHDSGYLYLYLAYANRKLDNEKEYQKYLTLAQKGKLSMDDLPGLLSLPVSKEIIRW